MIRDVVLDTNVMLHAQNPAIPAFHSSNELLRRLDGCETALCVDEGADLVVEARNRSIIVSEYLKHVRFGSTAFAFLLRIATARRLRPITKRIDIATRQQINQHIRNKVDRTFLAVSVNTAERILVSHDYEDYSLAKRNLLKKLTGVSIIDAAECGELLTP